MSQLATLSSIYHKPPEAFVMKSLVQSTGDGEEDDEVMEEEPVDPNAPVEHHDYTPAAAAAPVKSGGGDLLDLDLDETPAPAPVAVAPSIPQSNFDLLGGLGGPAAPVAPSKPSLVTSDVGGGVFINGLMTKINGQLCLDLVVGNSSPTPVQSLAIQFNKNSFGVAPVNPAISLSSAVSNGSSVPFVINLACSPQMLNPAEATLKIQAAVKNNATNAVFYFTIPVNMEYLMAPSPAMDVQALVAAWKSIDDTLEVSAVVNNLPTVDVEAIKAKLSTHSITFVAQRDVPGQEGQFVVYYSCKTVTNASFLVELKFKRGMNVC